MEEIYAASCVGEVLILACIDPFSSITRNDLHRITLFFGEFLTEQAEDILTVPFMDPDHTICVEIVHNRDVLVPVLVAGFIHTDTPDAPESHGNIWFKSPMGGCYAVPNSSPVDAKVFSNDCFRGNCSKVCNLVVKASQVMRVPILPGEPLGTNPTFGA